MDCQLDLAAHCLLRRSAVVGHDLLVVLLAVVFGQFFFRLGKSTFNVGRLTILQSVVPGGVMGRIGVRWQVLG
jgi:hypothetical protein